jgi:hypothetical protein
MGCLAKVLVFDFHDRLELILRIRMKRGHVDDIIETATSCFESAF